MKQTLIVALCLLGFSPSFSQSKSFAALETRFAEKDDVFSFHTSGFAARTILMLAGEHEFRKSIRKIKDIRFITIPQSMLRKSITVDGFRHNLQKDSFDELARIREDQDDIWLYAQNQENGSGNRYLILIHNPDELVAVEIKGVIDINALTRDPLAYESE